MSVSIGTDLDHAAELLRAGRLVGIPTETVYGLGANALDEQAVARIFAAKNRPEFDPLIVHFAEREWLDRLALELPATARRLADAFWPGPLTLVVRKQPCVPDLVTSGLATVALRMPAHPLALELLRRVDLPIAAPSANPFGRISPTTAQHVADLLGDRVDYILDGGPCQIGVESTVVQVADDTPSPLLLRPGGLPLEDLEACVGHIAIPAEANHPSTQAQPSPGRLPRHYAPRTPLQLVDDAAGLDGARCGLLLPQPVPDTTRFQVVEVLSETGDLEEATAGFFAAMRRLDDLGLDRIYAMPFPERGLGRALNDRLRRAAEKSAE